MQRSHRVADSTQGWHVGGWKAGQARLGEAQKLGCTSSGPSSGDVRKKVSSVSSEELLYCRGPGSGPLASVL